MDNLYYQFGGNSGYKIHLPVIPDANDPLTKKIAAYLDNLYGTTEADRFGFSDMGGGKQGCYSEYFKIGNCSDSMEMGKGMTIYGKESTADEMRKLAQDIENKFGKEIQAVKTKHNIISTTCDTQLTPVVTGRFNTSVQKGKGTHSVNLCGFNGCGDSNYNHTKNPSAAPTVLKFKTINGKMMDGCLAIDAPFNPKVRDIDKKFCWGASTMETIDHYGELFTGKIENGKVPQFIMDGLPKEYLQHYNLTEKDIIIRINKGTKLFVANMLEDMVNTPNSQAFRKASWLASLDTQVIDEAKQLLAQYEPQTVQKLEQMLPQLEKQYPALSVLKQTTPFAQMKITPVQQPKPQVNPSNPVKPNSTNPVGTQNPVNPTPKPQTNSKPNITSNTPKVGWFEKLGTKGKVGIAITGAALVAGSVYALAHYHSTKKETVLSQNDIPSPINVPEKQLETYQNLYNNRYYGPYQKISMNNLRI